MRVGNFFRSIIPVVLILVLQVAVQIVLSIFYILQGGGFSSISIIEAITTVGSDSDYLQMISLIYGVLGFIIFGLWYRRAFIRPHKGQKRSYPTGFSIHTILSLIILAAGLQLLCSKLLLWMESAFPQSYENYNSLMDTAGFSSVTGILLVYTLILAPIVEELVFRGLVYRFARKAMPFIAANIWQAALFGIMHMNLIQGLYAFVMGLFLGYVAHRGHGIKYSILFHIAFNFLGVFNAGLFDALNKSFALPALALMVVLIVLGIAIFHADFKQPVKQQSRSNTHESRRYRDDDDLDFIDLD